jgi:hypothetical protein
MRKDDLELKIHFAFELELSSSEEEQVASRAFYILRTHAADLDTHAVVYGAEAKDSGVLNS